MVIMQQSPEITVAYLFTEHLAKGPRLYKPSPVRRKEIPKPGGGVRLLGIPTVLDRLIQQAIAQVFKEIWDPTFSNSSFGFRLSG